jgi:hypothetical protein
MKVSSVQKWPWKNILVCVGWLLLVVGVAPGAYILMRLGNTHSEKPLSVPVSLKQGEFTSPTFTADGSRDYLIDLTWDLFPARQTSVDLDWKVVADNGSVVQQGSFNNLLRGANTIRLGSYKPNPGQRERIVLNVHADVDQGGAHAKLDVGPMESWLGLANDLPFVSGWAFLVAGPGVLLLLGLAVVGGFRRRKVGIAA